MDFRDVVRRRRMVRSFTDEPVAPEILERILDVARRGPSAGYSQGVDLILVTDEAMRSKVARRDDETLRKAGLPNFVAQVPVLIVICVNPAVYTSRYREPDKMRLREGVGDDDFWNVPYWHTDAGCALMLILLAAVNEGIAAGLVGVMGAAGQARIRALLGIPEDRVAVGVVTLGHEAPDANDFPGSRRTRPRRPLADLVHRERW